MELFNKLLNSLGFKTTLGVTVHEIKEPRQQHEEPNISAYTTAYSYPDGIKKAHIDIRVIADIKLTPRSKVKTVRIIIPFDQTAMEEILNKLKKECNNE